MKTEQRRLRKNSQTSRRKIHRGSMTEAKGEESIQEEDLMVDIKASKTSSRMRTKERSLNLAAKRSPMTLKKPSAVEW